MALERRRWFRLLARDVAEKIGPPLDELHRKEPLPPFLEQLSERGEVLVPNILHSAKLAFEEPEELRGRVAERLQRDLRLAPAVHGVKDLARRAPAEILDDAKALRATESAGSGAHRAADPRGAARRSRP